MKGNTLKPSAGAVLNARSWPTTTNPLKRTASQVNTISPSLSRQGSASSNRTFIRQDSVASGNTFGGFSQASVDGGRLGKLHEGVWFDENDFEDDADIDLDADDQQLAKTSFGAQVSYPSLEGPAASQKSPPQPPNPAGSQIPYPTLPLPAPIALPIQPRESNATLSWSSSPPYHKLSPPPKEMPPANRGKRRTIPWQNVEGSQPKVPVVAPAAVQQILDRNNANKGEQGSDQASFTPILKDKPHSPYPWNKTASALKEEQKRLRQGNKKLVRNNEADEDTKKNASTKKKAGIARVYLSDEQRMVLNLVTEERKSVFFTGSAGTGKSVLLREIIKTLRVKHRTQPDRVAVTASTGLAACNVGGVTLHSFAGIGLGKEDIPELVKKIKRNQKAKNRWMRTKILIVDEISMVDGELFDKLEGIARIIRNNGRPFGGIQLVITGDFFQLPPVPDYGKISKFAFDAATWNTSIEHTIGLTQVFRQKDPVFANMLNEMRLGKLSPQSIETFRSLSRPLAFGDDFEATELFPTRQEVDNANSNRMRNLTGKSWDFRADDGGSIQDRSQRDKLLSNCMAAPLITLKQGSQVMLIKNIDETLVNGSVGKVVAFMDEKTFDIYHEDEDEFQAAETMDLNDEDMTQSRKKLKAAINGDTSQKWPLVRFGLSDGSSRDLLCQKESWKIELPNGEVQASRSQVPLILAWALSIHKAQGQTLERVKVDLGKIFEKGQAYVALSRATCQEGLQITRFDPKKVMAHDKVRAFYNSLYSIEEARVSATSGFGGASKKVETVKNFNPDLMHRGHASDDDNDALQELFM